MTGLLEGELQPADISIDGNSKAIYIADKGNNRNQKLYSDCNSLQSGGMSNSWPHFYPVDRF